MPRLAVVIPAYKGAFLQKTLESLALQTNQDFSVYIGNDDGDKNIEQIVQQFAGRLIITYKYFNDNMGSISLVKQWERCFALTQNEEWLWLLPDDDYADPACVSLFYKNVLQYDFDLWRFNVKFVTDEGSVFKTNAELPEIQSAFDSLLEKLSFVRPSTVAEFIFRKAKFDQTGFAEIPMAWGTDDMLWFLMGRDKGIFGCNEAFVYLRQSHLNFSNNYHSLGEKKIAANFIFFNMLLQTEAFAAEIADENKKEQFKKTAINHIMYNLQDFSLKPRLPDMIWYAIKGNRIWGGGILANIRRFYLNNKRISQKN